MAVNTFTGSVDNLWGNAGNWSLGTIPTSTDGHVTTFDAASPACTLTGYAPCYKLDMTNYTGTLTFGIYALAVYDNSIIFGSGATLSMAGGYLWSYANNLNVSIKSNGCYVPYLYLGGINPHTITLLDNFNVGTFKHCLTTNVLLTVNGFKILVNDNYDLDIGLRTMDGTTVIEFTGGANCSWGGTVNSALVSNPIIINKSGGTLTLGPYIYLNTGCILTHISGTVDAGTGVFVAKGVTFNVGTGVTFNSLYIAGTSTFNTDTYCITLLVGQFGNTTMAGVANINMTNLRLLPISAGYQLNLIKDISTTNLYLNNNQYNVGYSLRLNGGTINVSGNIESTNNSQFSQRSIYGTGSITYIGTGYIDSTTVLMLPFIINTTGTLYVKNISIGGNGAATYGYGSIVYTAGTVDCTTYNGTLMICMRSIAVVSNSSNNFNAGRINASGVAWKNVKCINPDIVCGVYLDADFTCENFYINAYLFAILGVGNMTCNNLQLQGTDYLMSFGDYNGPFYNLSGRLMLTSTQTYTINNSLKVYSTPEYPMLIAAYTSGSKANLIFNGTTQEVINCDVTDINSSSGNTIWTLNGTITNSDNWSVSNSSIVPVTIAKTF